MSFTVNKMSDISKLRELQKAVKVFALSKRYTEEQVRSQFKALVQANHPDATDLPRAEGTYTLELLRKSKEVLLKNLENNNA